MTRERGGNMRKVRRLLLGLATAGVLGGLAATVPAAADSSSGQLDALDPARRVAVGLERLGFCLASAALQTAPDRNVLIAPTGAGRILAMIGAGSPLPVRQKIAALLAWPEFLGGSLAFGVSLDRARLSADASPDVTLRLATGIWHDRNHEPRTYFALHAGAGLQAMDPADPATTDRINAWISDRTDGMIAEAITDIPAETTILMADVLAFSGAWSTPFDPEETRRAAFASGTPLATEVAMMQSRRQVLPHRRDAHGDWLTLPYGDGRFEAVLVQPTAFELGSFGRMACETVGGLTVPVAATDSHSLTLRLPRMKLDATASLDQLLHQARLGDVLDDPLLGSSMLTPATRPGPIRQQVALTVDEKGSKVAAATIAIGTRAGAEPVELNFDRPFVLMIREQTTGLPLLIGMINRPGDASGTDE
ncbi:MULTISPECIES: serpin family protein [unclassified Minwuia]|jgi:serine protease inhibitor|uniref:serpin family protein n=1 Tax=unclassified Minwuia TaxID=2618799 RepID=UPI00247AA8B7|nr:MULTISPECIES: serpin family protein [unclassified Minwuia]